jgi:hypothetical protein
MPATMGIGMRGDGLVSSAMSIYSPLQPVFQQLPATGLYGLYAVALGAAFGGCRPLRGNVLWGLETPLSGHAMCSVECAVADFASAPVCIFTWGRPLRSAMKADE